jgi:hypothetical protein
VTAADEVLAAIDDALGRQPAPVYEGLGEEYRAALARIRLDVVAMRLIAEVNGGRN